MDILIVGCGWVGTYLATELLDAGHRVWATCTSTEKAQRLETLGLTAAVADFDTDEGLPDLGQQVFDVAIISVPITRKDNMTVVQGRFARLVDFLRRVSFNQSFFFGSVGIYPKVSATILETTFSDAELAPKLLWGEHALRAAYPNLNILRLGGLFGFERVMAKYFVGKVCEIGYQTANSVHVEDIYGVIAATMAASTQKKTYNLVCPEHPLKKDVIAASAAKYGYGMPTAFSAADKTAKVVSPERLIADLGYRFKYRSPLEF
ncbi:NAD-binding protein [Parapedobacter sp. 10938]|uniref:NAD-binding protein n=1 Tax=Parapedobacter flavus TaxID=3110225 RepID=UPI002DBD4D78|nr:NAD-binding protein [Parapedobacter sp. 10938]MEC3880345.1 NAD-binding protein [Parapedobacter sp. 10938]